jgi:two-component system NtrC family sensor kinase
LLQRPYTAVRDRVTLAFAAIALFCFALIVVVTYFLTRSLVRPLEDMAAVSKEIASGDLTHRVQVTDQSELGLLSSSFNAMLDRIHDMNTQLEQWAKMLEQKVAERTEQLVKTQAAMDRQQRLASLGQLAAGVAHEINNPLGGILTFASLVQEELPKDSPIRGDVEEVVRQADRCRRIVQELLEFSRQREAQTAPHSINEIVGRTLTLLEKQASFHDIKIVREFDPTRPIAVVDDSQLQQVFMNIILNAADAMNERGTLTVTTAHDRAAQEVFISFTDTGRGIPEDMREAIFDPFFSTKAPGKGTGLGLAVACRIVQAHRGRVEVASEVGRGSTFTVVLPLSTGPPADNVTSQDSALV